LQAVIGDYPLERLQVLFFYSNEHRPMHVHVRYGSGEAVFEVEQRVELRESQGLRVRELAKAEELATDHRGLISMARAD
jgi:Domain of unknown function (DUF4160)